MANVSVEETHSLLTPLSPVPLNLAGFLTGNTIHVEGDAGNLHFSGQFDIHQKETSNDLSHHFPGTYTPEKMIPDNRIISISNLFSSTTHNTIEEKDTTHNTIEERDQLTNTNPSTHLEITPELTEIIRVFTQPELSILDQGDGQISVTGKRDDTNEVTVVTRLRSGVISPISYFPSVRRGSFVKVSDHGAGTDPWVSRKLKLRGKGKEERDVLKKVLRRRSFPVKPCSSYSFFVMTNWVSAKSSSFEKTSKRLSEIWSKLTDTDKKVFVDMALKDNARYKKQCFLLGKKVRCPVG